MSMMPSASRVRSSRRRAERRDGVPGEVGANPERAAKRALGRHPAEHDVGVGHRGLDAPEAVGGGPGLSAGTARADLERAVDVEPGDGSAAGADRPDVDLSDLHREGSDEVIGRRQWPAVPHEADVRARAAHVVRDEVGDTRPRSGEAALAHAAGRPGHRRADREPSRGLDGHHSAARSDRQHPVGVAGLEQLLLQPREIAVHQRLQVGVEHRGRESLELAVLRHDVGRERHRHLGKALAEALADGALVSGIGVGVEQADGQSLGRRSRERVDHAIDAAAVERCEHRAVVEHALVDLEPQRALDEGLRSHERRHEQHGDVALGSADLDQVAEARGRDQGHASPAPLEDRVGSHRRAVDEPAHAAAVDAEGGETRQDGGGLVVRL